MSFNREFFDTFKDRLKQYQNHFPTGWVNVTITVAYDQEFKVRRILALDEDFVTFAYVEPKRQWKLPKGIQKEDQEPYAFPVVILPYSAIQRIEISPGGTQGSKEMGFQQKGSFFSE